MDILGALKEEESKLEGQLKAIQGAIAALNGGAKTAEPLEHAINSNGASAKRTMSAFVRAKIARAAKARWAKIRAAKAKARK